MDTLSSAHPMLNQANERWPVTSASDLHPLGTTLDFLASPSRILLVIWLRDIEKKDFISVRMILPAFNVYWDHNFKQAGIQALHSSSSCLKCYWEGRSAPTHRQYCMIEIPVSPYTQGDIISSFCSLADSCKFLMSNVDMIQASILLFLLGISVTCTFAVFSPEKLVCIAGSSIVPRIWLCFYVHSALLVLAVRIVDAHVCSFKRLARCALTSCPRLLSSLGENSITSSCCAQDIIDSTSKGSASSLVGVGAYIVYVEVGSTPVDCGSVP
ncbi:hypothetical protein EDB19DRAFT_1342651 [Suillus lakei]|nr:hypothetical protein EDB19DRAFT_1342651 [Suillus lakei]